MRLDREELREALRQHDHTGHSRMYDSFGD